MKTFRSIPAPRGVALSSASRDSETTAILNYLLVRCRSEVRFDARLGATLSQWATEARSAGLLPERMVVALKELWYEYADHTTDREKERKGVTLPGVLGTALTACFAAATDRAGRDLGAFPARQR